MPYEPFSRPQPQYWIKFQDPCARFLSSTGLVSGNLIGRAQFPPAPALDKNRSPISQTLVGPPDPESQKPPNQTAPSHSEGGLLMNSSNMIGSGLGYLLRRELAAAPLCFGFLQIEHTQE